jgi:hypothetical protein
MGGFSYEPRGTVLVENTQFRWFSEQSGGRLDLKEATKGTQN